MKCKIKFESIGILMQWKEIRGTLFGTTVVKQLNQETIPGSGGSPPARQAGTPGAFFACLTADRGTFEPAPMHIGGHAKRYSFINNPQSTQTIPLKSLKHHTL